MDKSFKHLSNYHFYNYLSTIIEKKNNNFPIYLNFKNHLINILKVFGIKRDDIESKVNELKEGNISDINKDIINIIVKIKKKFRRGFLDIDEKDFQISENDNEDTLLGEDSNYDNNDNIYELKSLDILYYFYYCHKKNLLIPPISNETTNLLDYFKNKKQSKKDKIKSIEKNNIDLKATANKSIINHLKELSEKLEELKINIKSNRNIINEIKQLIDFLEIYTVIFIPFIDPTDAGKATIINGIIGKDLLPTGLKEFTKRILLLDMLI